MPVFYLKYRPQKISELDLVKVREELTKVLAKKEKPHAFLFCGPKGTGKTSAARILAKAVNCLKNNGVGEPCNRCEICQEITRGVAIDLYEIDGASNRGIDDIRELREKIKLSPAKAQKKVYIIDEVHMLTSEAFNALLKTLEEPPEHAIFVLCTTAVQKLPETIVSRCMRFNFKKASLEETILSLKRVAKGEKLKVEKEALEEIARASSGSFRDAAKLLEQVSLTSNKVTSSLVRKVLGEIESFPSSDLLKLLVKKEAKNSILWIDEAIKEGVDLKTLIESLIDTLRKMLLKKIGLPWEIDEEELFEKLTVVEIKKLIRLLMLASKEMASAVIPQIPLEIAIIEWCGIDNNGFQNDGADNQNLSHRRKTEESEGKSKVFKKRGNGDLGFSEVEKKWDQVLGELRVVNHSVEALLRSCRPVSIAGDFLTIEVFYKFHKERLETVNYRQMIEKVVYNLLGRPLRLKWVLKEREIKKEKREENISGKQVEDDVIRAAEEIFGGKVD